MKIRTDGYTHFQKIQVTGDITETGNGLQLRPALTSGIPVIAAVGDDATVSASLAVKVASVETPRLFCNAAAKTIVDGSATALFNVSVPTSAMVGGHVDFLIRATDATDMQALAGRAVYASVNKAGTLTSTITYTTAPEAKAVSSGTLTLSFTVAENPADYVEIRLQPTGSLTESTYTIEYNVQPIRGAVTIL